jgi:hypothetical protein
MSETQKGLSRKFIVESFLHIVNTVPAERRWGSWQISYQNGIWKTIEEKKTTVTEENEHRS